MRNLIINKQYNNFLWIICLLATSSFLLTINLPLIGEEGVYTNAALEMIFAKQYKFATLYGNIYPRPPLYNWLIILFNKFSHPKNIVISARLVALTATIITALGVFLTSKNLFILTQAKHTPDHKSLSHKKTFLFSILATAIFLSGDVLFKRGWLAYSDPAFASFVFISTAMLLLGAIHNKYLLIIYANVFLFLGFLSKVHTAYVFYAITFLVLSFSKYKKNLLQAKIIGLHLVFIIPLLIWNKYCSGSDCFFTIFDHIKKLIGITNNPEANIWKNIITFPIQTWLALFPGSLVAIFGIKKLSTHNQTIPEIIKILSWVVLLNFAPYWITSQTHIRYLLPIYPWFAIITAYIVFKSELIKHTIILLFTGVIIKYVVAIYWFPYQYITKYGNAKLIANNILLHTKHYPLYINSFSASGLRIAGEINIINWPKQPLQEHPKDHGCYFMLQEDPISDSITQQAQLVDSYRLNKDQIYLYLYSEPSQT